MPSTFKIRERLIRLLWEGPALRRTIESRFGQSRRLVAQEQLSLLISDGVVLSTGLGRRGHPNMVQLSQVYPLHGLCPLCKQAFTSNGEQWGSNAVKFKEMVQDWVTRTDKHGLPETLAIVAPKN